jgi:hypothetical protein
MHTHTHASRSPALLTCIPSRPATYPCSSQGPNSHLKKKNKKEKEKEDVQTIDKVSLVSFPAYVGKCPVCLYRANRADKAGKVKHLVAQFREKPLYSVVFPPN